VRKIFPQIDLLAVLIPDRRESKPMQQKPFFSSSEKLKLKNEMEKKEEFRVARFFVTQYTKMGIF
jgi:hypothetical protein